jgi:exosortase
MKVRVLSPYLLYGMIITGLFIGIYYHTFLWMYGRFVSPDSYYSHGFFIPLVTIFLIWQKREILGKTVIQYSNYGLLLIIAGLIIHLLSIVFYIFSASGFSMILVILGSSLFLFGSPITRVIIFPLLYLVFMFPFPESFISTVADPLKLAVAQIATFVVDQMGISVYREGYYIHTVNGELLVGNPCSGLRSLISFLALGSLFAFFLNGSKTRKFLLFFLSIPIALASNAVRVTALVLVTNFYGIAKASPDSFFHDFSGIMVFAIGLLILMGIGKVLECKQ